jgi:hypothetical protein
MNLAEILSHLPNAVRDQSLSESEIRGRQEGRQLLSVVMVASVVVSAVFFLFFAALPNLFTFSLFAIVGFISYEVIQCCRNFAEILDDAQVEVKARISRRALIDQLSKNTLTVKTFLNLIPPDRFREITAITT